jgi:tetratricopeptide (TPR) repeat protein
VNRHHAGTVVLAALWGVALTATAVAASDLVAEHDKCVLEAETDPKAALLHAKEWAEQGGGIDADHCAAMALYDMKHYTDAARDFEKVARAMATATPAAQARVFDQAGLAWLIADRPFSAKTDFDSALRLTPDDPDVLIDRAQALVAVGKFWNAIDDLNRASDLAPNRADIYAYRAAAYRAVNEMEMAREDIARDLTLAPNNPVGLLERGNIRRIDGDLIGARDDWRQVIKIAPKSPEAKAAHENLERLGALRDRGRPGARREKGPS